MAQSSMAAEAARIAFPYQREDLSGCLRLSFFSSFNNYVPIVEITVLFIYLGSDGRLHIVPEILNEQIVYGSRAIIKFFKDGLQVLYISQLVYNVLQLILFDATKLLSDVINKDSGLTQTLL